MPGRGASSPAPPHTSVDLPAPSGPGSSDALAGGDEQFEMLENPCKSCSHLRGQRTLPTLRRSAPGARLTSCGSGNSKLNSESACTASTSVMRSSVPDDALRQQRQIAHLMSFINRFKAQATKATQAQSRIKQLERMTLVEAVHADSEFSFEFPEPQRLPSPLVRFNEASSATSRRESGDGSLQGIISGISNSHRPRRAHRPARPQRRGQVHAGAHAGRRDAPLSGTPRSPT